MEIGIAMPIENTRRPMCDHEIKMKMHIEDDHRPKRVRIRYEEKR